MRYSKSCAIWGLMYLIVMPLAALLLTFLLASL